MVQKQPENGDTTIMKPIRRDMLRPSTENRCDFWVRLNMGKSINNMPGPGAEIPVILEEVKYSYG
jgi:hypothetical protein